MSLDHIIPPKQGGSRGIENVHWVLYRVNRMKSDMLEGEFFRMCQRVLEMRGYQIIAPANRRDSCL